MSLATNGVDALEAVDHGLAPSRGVVLRGGSICQVFMM